MPLSDSLKRERDRLKDEIDVRKLVEEDLGKPAEKSIRYTMHHCPIGGHSTGSTPSFAVYEDHYFCFGCGKTGDCFTYIQERMSVSFEDSIRILGGNVEKDFTKYSKNPNEKTPEKREFTMALSEVESYHSRVNLVRPYLEQRKIPDGIIESRMLGGSRYSKTYTDLHGERWDFECNRVVFPYIFDDKIYSVNFRRDDLSARENMKAVAQRRRVDDLFSLIRNDLAEKAGHGDPGKVSDEKVMIACYGTRFYRPGSPVTAYGVNNLIYRRDNSLVYPKQSHCVLTEGEFNQSSGEAERFVTLAVKSVSNVNLPRLLQNVRLIYVAVDPDEAGRRYAQMIFNALGNDATRVRFLNMHQDMNEFLKQGKLTDFLSGKPYFIQPSL